VQSLCTRVIWLDGGKIVEEGQPDKAVSSYLQTSLSTSTEQVWNDLTAMPGNDVVRFQRACVRPENGSSLDPITIRTPLAIEFEYWNLVQNAYLNLSLALFNEQGVFVLAAAPVHEPVWHGRPFPTGLFRSVCRVPSDLLNNGTHRITLLVVENEGSIIYRHDDILTFEVRDSVEMRGNWYGKWPGAVRPNLKWSTELVESGQSSAMPIELNGHKGRVVKK